MIANAGQRGGEVWGLQGLDVAYPGGRRHVPLVGGELHHGRYIVPEVWGEPRQVRVRHGAAHLRGRQAGKDVVELRQREAGLIVGAQHLQEPGEPRLGVLEL